MPLAVTTAAAAEPVTLAEAKTHLRVTADGDNPRIAGMITAAIRTVENRLRRRLVTQSLRLWLDAFPCDPETIVLQGPVASVTQVRYYDSANALQTLATSAYDADLVSVPARLCRAFGQVWPLTYCRPNAVQVDYVAGTGPGSVPAEVKQAILLLIGDQYDGTDSSRTVQDLLFSAPVST